MLTLPAVRDALRHAPGRTPGFPFAAELTPGRLDLLRSAPAFAPILAELRAEAERATLSEPPLLPLSLLRTFERSGERRGYEDRYFDRRRRLNGLALTALVDGTDAHLEALENLIWAMLDEYTWALPACLGNLDGRPEEAVVDLFAAETAHALAETLALLGEHLDPRLHRRVRAEVERRVFRPLFDDARPLWWESAPSNWAAVCAGAGGMAALLLEEDRLRLAGMVHRTLRALEVFLTSYGEDGGCAEGINYWTYGFGYFVYFAEMLRDFTGGRLDLLGPESPGHAKLRRVAAFPGTVALGGTRFVNFSDASLEGWLRPGLVSRLAARLGTEPPELTGLPPLDDDHCHRWGHASRDLLWTDPGDLGRATPPATVHLPDLGWTLDRTFVDGRALAFAAKGGHNDEPHNHNDLGHFVVQVGRESLLADLGAGVYSRQYFGPERYASPHAASRGHSVPVVDGQEQAPGRDREARVTRFERTPGGLVFELNLTAAYDVPTLTGLTRRFVWTRDGGRARLDLTDEFEFSQAPTSLEEVFVSLHEPRLEAGRACWTGADGAVSLSYDAARLTARVEALPTHSHRGAPLTAYRLCLTAIRPGVREGYTFHFLAETSRITTHHEDPHPERTA